MITGSSIAEPKGISTKPAIIDINSIDADRADLVLRVTVASRPRARLGAAT